MGALHIFEPSLPKPREGAATITDAAVRVFLGLSNDQSRTIMTALDDGGNEYDLRIVSCDDSQYFEWIDQSGDPAGDVFDEINPDLNIEAQVFFDKLSSLQQTNTVNAIEESGEEADDDDDDNECGQCDGTGTTQSASNLEEEECPVCGGSGMM